MQKNTSEGNLGNSNTGIRRPPPLDPMPRALEPSDSSASRAQRQRAREKAKAAAKLLGNTLKLLRLAEVCCRPPSEFTGGSGGSGGLVAFDSSKTEGEWRFAEDFPLSLVWWFRQMGGRT